MLYTLEQLRAENSYNADRITAAHVNEINEYINKIESTRTATPQQFDDVDFVTECGEHTEHATIEGRNPAHPYKIAICERGTPSPTREDDGTLRAFIGAGGGSHDYDPAKMEYIGTAKKRCQIITGDFITGFFSIYFYCTVSRFYYNAQRSPER